MLATAVTMVLTDRHFGTTFFNAAGGGDPVSIPTGVKVFNWVATMWKGALSFEAPMLLAVGFLWVFTIGGFSGLILAVAPIDIQMQDTYYVEAHFHYVLVAGSLFALSSSYYYWAPKWTGHMVNESRARAEGLEWTVPSPAPYHTFETPPLVK